MHPSLAAGPAVLVWATQKHTHTQAHSHTHTHTHTQAQRNVVARMRPTLAAGPAVYARRKTNVKKIKAAM